MQPVLNIEDVRTVEKKLASVGVSISELMHRAGAEIAHEVLAMGPVENVVILAGVGNNGGDGWVCAQLLKEQGLNVAVISAAPLDQLGSDLARVAANGARAKDVEILVAPPREDLEAMVSSADVVVDAMLGTGFHGDLRQPFDIWVDVVNASGVPVIAVDVPSGLNAQTGHSHGQCIIAETTVTMICLKPGLLSGEGRDVCGRIVVAPLAEQTEELVVDQDPVAWRCDDEDYLSILPSSTAVQDKYSRGSVLVVGGSQRYPGAAIMAAQAASRAGAGYVALAVPAQVAPIAQLSLLNVPVIPLPCDENGFFGPGAHEMVAKLAPKFSAVVVGPGMGVSSSSISIVTTLLDTTASLVIDADGLNCLARLTNERVDLFPELLRRSAPVILTPHARELGRLIGLAHTPPQSLTSAMEAARRIVWTVGGNELAVVAKGNATACIGVEVGLLPKPGPAALATAGTGDVLSGIIGSMLAHNPVNTEDLVLLCALACRVHGTACALAQEDFGSEGVIATDLIPKIGVAWDTMVAKATNMEEFTLEDIQE